MPASYCHLAVHIIFSTKERVPWLKPDPRLEMHSYLGGIVNKLTGIPLAIGGTENHVHILCLMPKDLSIAEFVSKIKANSSKWFRAKHHPHFNWQEGYGAFSVSRSNIETVIKYIIDQDEHHHHTSAKEEFENILKKHWDPEKVFGRHEG